MEKTYIGNGTSSLVYRLNEDQALNVYFAHPPKVTEKIFDAMHKARDAEINVPTPLELTSTVISESDLENIGLLGKLVIGSTIFRWPKIMVGIEFSAIRREFIPGKNLGGRIFPRRKIRKKVQEQMKRIKDARMVIYDIDPKSFVLRSDGELFLVDYEKLYDIEKDKPSAVGITSRLVSKYPPICMPQNILAFIGHLTSFPNGPMIHSDRYK